LLSDVERNRPFQPLFSNVRPGAIKYFLSYSGCTSVLTQPLLELSTSSID